VSQSFVCRHNSPCSAPEVAAFSPNVPKLIPEIKVPSNVKIGAFRHTPAELAIAGSGRDERYASQNWRSCTGSRTFQACLDSSPRCGAEWRSRYCQVTEVSCFPLAPAAGPLARTTAYLAARVPPALLFDSRSDMLWPDHFRGVAHCQCIRGRCRCSLARRPRPISSWASIAPLERHTIPIPHATAIPVLASRKRSHHTKPVHLKLLFLHGGQLVRAEPIRRPVLFNLLNRRLERHDFSSRQVAKPVARMACSDVEGLDAIVSI